MENTFTHYVHELSNKLIKPHWNKSDIGKVIEYRGINHITEKVVIFNYNKEIPTNVEVLGFPITLNSSLAILGLVKNQEKKSKEELKNAGDWYFIKKASSEEMNVLKKFAEAPKTIDDFM